MSTGRAGGNGATSAAAIAATAATHTNVFDALHAKMELANYAQGQSRQKVKRVPWNQAPEQMTRQKALLEEADMMDMAIKVDDDDHRPGGENNGRRKQLPGSKVVFDVAVMKSMPALPIIRKCPEDAKNGIRGAGIKEDRDNVGALNEDLDE
jgi:hypothetical protein